MDCCTSDFIFGILLILVDRKKPLTKIEKRNILFQTLQGIHFMHKIGYFHRDLKPENLLEFKGTVKIADFGLAKQTHLNPPFTEYISTRWYRAPELILGDQKYGKEIDIYAIGCIFAELLANGKPLFPGKNEIDQMDQILRVMGRFDTGTNRWDYGIGLVRKLGYKIPTGIPSKTLKTFFQIFYTFFIFGKYFQKNFTKFLGQSLLRNTLSDYDIEEPAMDLLEKMLIYDPSKRINALECLQHQYFQVNIPVQIEDQPVFTSNLDFVDHKEEPRRQTNDQRNAKKTSYYLRKARYKPGVNLSEMLRNNLN